MIHLQPSMIRDLLVPEPTVPAVRKALQQAIELEHATIPLYLYALYSLNGNPDIASIIQSVVIEEMLHMTLASNVLNALGGTPKIGQPGFIPTYPGPLPGGVESQLTVHLAPFSMQQLDTFLAIETPEDPIEIHKGMAAAAEGQHITIGMFYTSIRDALPKLPAKEWFVKPPRNQVGPDLMEESVVVTGVATAQQAINTIIDQGEGTSKSPEEVVGSDYAHYYRFMEIKEGRRIVKVPGAKPPYAYAGESVPFDPAAVYAVPTDPKSTGYRPGSAQAFANNNFNYTYTSLLLALNSMFNGEATQSQFNIALGLMMSLKGQAKAMMAGIPDPNVLAGPSFEYHPVNPLPQPGLSGEVSHG